MASTPSRHRTSVQSGHSFRSNLDTDSGRLRGSVRIPPQSLSGFDRNQCPEWSGIAVQFRPDSLSRFNRRRHTFHGSNPMGTFGPAIKIWVDDVNVARFNTSCSEEIGPGLVSSDFEIVEGFSRNGGRLCATSDGDPDSEEPSCGECDGQVSSLTLRYVGEEGSLIEVRQQFRGQRVLVFEGSVEPGEAFSFMGLNRQGTLGAKIWVYVDGTLDATFDTSCSAEIGPGAVQGYLEVVEGFSRNGGRLCAASGD